MIRTLIPAVALALAGCGSAPDQSASGGAQPADDAGIAAPLGGADTAATPANAGEPARVSRFTKVDETACRKVSEDKETGDWTGTCPGLDGYALGWTIGDLRDDLVIVRGDARQPLGIPSKVANGAFDSIGETVEWRGPEGGAADVLVTRVHVANDQGENDGGHLTVVRLGQAPCIVAVVPPGAGQSDKARAIADGDLPACLAD